MSDSPLSPQDIRAAAAAHEELGPEYSDAVVASFLGKVEDEVAARVEARLAGARQPAPPASPDSRGTLLKGVGIGIGVSAFAVVAVGGNPDERLKRLLLVLLALAVICTVSWTVRQCSSRRYIRQRPRAAAIPRSDRRLL